MEDYVGKICPFCKTPILEGEAVKVCPSCGIPHHESCWEENKGCTTFGCSEHHYEEQHTNPTDVCSKCGAPLGPGQDFCPQCGTPKNAPPAENSEVPSAPQKRICSKCGAELEEGQIFCPKCGTKADVSVDPEINNAINQFNSNIKKSPVDLSSLKNLKDLKDKKKPAIIAAAVVIVIILIVALSGGKKNFKKMYSDYAKEDWCYISSDGSYMTIDTNPDDIDSDYLYTIYDTYLAADEAIQQINSDLGFSSALYEKMNTTTWSQGKQTDSNKKYTVTWTYHPDKGLEVLYEIK